MSIHGIGTDIVNISRIKKSLTKKLFINKIFSKSEAARCNHQINKINCFAKRFAAKEAFAKALGTGVANGISFNEIEVYNTSFGKPNIKLLGKTNKIVKKILKNKKFKVFLSLSDDKLLAVASVVISL